MATATDETETRHLSVAGKDGSDDPEAKQPPEKSIEEMAEDEAGEAARVPPTQLAIPGTRDRVTSTVGGKPPTDSELRIMGGRRPIVGEYAKGEFVTVVAETVVRQLDFVDHDDEWGTVSKTTRVHKARMLAVRPATPDVLVRELLKTLTPAEVKALVDEAV